MVTKRNQKNIPKEWIPQDETKYDLDWADLTNIDISTFDKPGGKEKLASQLKIALHKDGFWTVSGTGISEEEMNRLFALGEFFFNNYSEEEKKLQEVNFEEGNYFGYKIKGNKSVFGTDVPDNVETFNIAKFTKQGFFEEFFKQDFIKEYREELEGISRKSFEVARKLFVLFALILELDDNYFVNRHLYDDQSDDHLRFMKYHSREKEEDDRVENTWARGHTDFVV